MGTTKHSQRAAIWPRGELLALEPVPRSLRPDVCIVGAGIAGLLTAHQLLTRGRSVLVLEREAVCAGETSRSTAHASFALDDRYHVLERLHGSAGARLAYESHRAGLELIEEIARAEDIECGFRRLSGFLFASTRADAAELERERDAAERAGLHVTLRDEDVHGAIFEGPSLEFHDQGELNPVAFLAGLDRAVRRLGGHVAGPAEVVDAGGGISPWVELDDGTRIDAGAVVIASNVPFHARLAMHTKQAPYRTYAMALPIADRHAPEALVWDTFEPYHYARTVRVGGASPKTHLVVGGADEKTGQPSDSDPFGHLFTWAAAHFRIEGSVTHAWSGQVLEPADGLGYAGLAPGAEEDLYVITGDSGNGITHAALSAILVDALIHGEAHPWQRLYAPNRKPVRGAARWLRENVNVAAQLGDWLAPGDDEPGSELSPGEANITRQGIHRIARHRDEAGELHAFSARCPHFGCSVRWNGVEKTWDCPCHGSRFDPIDGHVLNGPAKRALTPASELRRAPRPERRTRG